MPAVAFKPRSKQVIRTRILLMRRSLERRVATALNRFFVQQAARVLTRLHFGAAKTLPSPNELLPYEEDGLLSVVLKPYLDAGILASADMAALMVGQTETLGVNVVQRLLDHSAERVTRINEGTRSAIRDLLQEGQLAGYNNYQLAHGVPESGFRGLDSVVRQTYRGRSEAIARTEIGQASQEAAHAQWHDLGVQYVEIIDGEDWDDECAARNGEVVSVGESVDLNHPLCTVISVPVANE